MNNLLVDIGNTRLKWRLQKDTELNGSLEVGGGESWPCLFARAWGDLPRPQRVVCVSVQPKAVFNALAQWVDSHWGLEVQAVHSSEMVGGVANGYLDPGTLGPDRLIAMVGARGRVTGPALVVDCGTAVTIDLLDAKGVHRGGWVLPGLTLMRRSLCRGTAAIGELSRDSPAAGLLPAFGTDTVSGVDHGIVGALTGAVQRALALATQELGARPACLVTGGDGAAVSRLVGDGCRYIPNLVLEGLGLYADENEPK